MLPNVDHPEAFGQHPNADIASQIIETRSGSVYSYLLQQSFSLFPSIVEEKRCVTRQKRQRGRQLLQWLTSKLKDSLQNRCYFFAFFRRVSEADVELKIRATGNVRLLRALLKNAKKRLFYRLPKNELENYIKGYQYSLQWLSTNKSQSHISRLLLLLSAQKILEFQLVLWASGAHILLAQDNFLLTCTSQLMILLQGDLPGSLPIGQVFF